MKEYGKLFKKFRESRGLVLKDIAKLGVSVYLIFPALNVKIQI